MTTEHGPKKQNLQTSANQSEFTDDYVKKIINSHVKTFNPFRRDRITEWNINIAYLCGQQNVRLAGGHLVENTEVSPYNVIANKIAPAVRNDVAMATKVPPKFDIVPDTTDTDDKATAIAAEKMAQYLRRLNDFDKQRGKIIIWYDIANIAWRKQYWDPFYKLIGHNPEPEEEGNNPDLPPGFPIYEGEAISVCVPTNEVIYDWRQNIEKLPWIIHARPATLSECTIMFGKEKALTIPEGAFIDPTSGYNEYEIKIFNQFKQYTNQTVSSKPDSSEMGEQDKQCILYELWQVRDRNYPYGLYAVQAGLDENAAVMTHQPYPIEQYPHGEVPLVGYDMLAFDKAIQGTASRISMARPLQRELNDIRTLILENTISLGNGVIYIHKDSTVSLRRLDNGPGLFIEYEGKKPDREQGQPASSQLFIYAREITNDINDIFSFPVVLQGKRPTGGPKSGVGIALLQEGAQTQHSPITNELDRRDERAMNQLLCVAFANYNNRLIPIIGKDNEWTLFEFKQESFSAKFHVSVRSGSSLPVSRAMEIDTTLGLLDRGLLGNPMDPTVRRRVLELVDIGGLDKILKEKNKDINFARREFQAPVIAYQNMLQKTGGMVTEEQINSMYFPTVNPFDDHEVHIPEHKSDLLDHFFEYLGTGDPGMIVIAQSMQAHFMEHSVIFQQQNIAQAIMTGQIKREDLEASQQNSPSQNKKQ